MASFDSINYSIRHGKGVERKMLCDLARRLSVFGQIEEYSYIGFGSIFFTDFILFHRALGVHDMHSIEREERVIRDPDIQNRFEFNKPFSCVNIHFGTAAKMLPKMNWDRKAIVWLDYDGKLEDEHLSDLEIVLRSAQAGSLIMVSTNIQADFPPSGSQEREKDFRYNELLKRLDTQYLPASAHTDNLSSTKLAEAYHYALTGIVNSTLTAKNGNSSNPMVAHQLINVRYKDNAEMLTVGWLITDKTQSVSLTNARFNDLNFVNTLPEPTKIQVPPLTIKEIQWLDSVLHTSINIDGTFKPGMQKPAPLLPPSAVSNYVKIYRYFPTFAEAIL